MKGLRLVENTKNTPVICEYCGEEVKSVYMISIIDENGNMEWHYGHKYCLNSLERKLEDK